MGRDSITVTYARIREELPRGALLLFHVGGYWEALGDCAQEVAKLCDLRPFLRWGTSFAAFAEDRLDTMLARMVRVGKTVALAERDEINERFEVVRLVQ